MSKYLDQAIEGQDVESVINDMLVDLIPPGKGEKKARVPKYKNNATAISPSNDSYPGEPGDGATSQTD